MKLPHTQPNEPNGMWEHQSARDYGELIGSANWDSRLLREAGLVPNLLDMIGDSRDARVLDVGTGTGWLFDCIKPAQAFACDIVAPQDLREEVDFQNQDVQSLTYDDDIFDIVVASLVLIYCKDLDAACNELFRVAKSNGGRLIVALVHPYFYRTGFVDENDNFVVTSDLSKRFNLPLKIADKVGPVDYFYRPLPEYVNSLLQSGWQLSEMSDWFINMDDYRKLAGESVKTNIKRSGQVPLFTFMHCRKP